MPTKYLFIDGVRGDKSTRRRARQHVMLGKNAGRKVYRPSKTKFASSRAASNKPADAVVERSLIEGTGLSLTLDKRLQNDFSTLWLPVHVSSTSLGIIHDFFVVTSDRIYSPDLGISLEDAKSLWLPSMLVDESTYHCSINMMQTCNQLILHGCETVDALCCLSRTLAHVNKRLRGPAALSDASIFMLMTLIMQEQIRQQSEAVEIHAKGLRKMIALRGGLTALEKDPGLAIKVCKLALFASFHRIAADHAAYRTDVVLALQQGGAPTYFRDNLVDAEKVLAAHGLHLKRSVVSSPNDALSLHSDLHEVFLDTMALCHLMNHEIQPSSLDLITYQDILLSLFYRLLRFRSLKDAQNTFDDHSVIQLGLLLFTMTVMLHHSTRRVIDFHLVSNCLQCIMDNITLEGDDTSMLWLLVIGGIWTAGTEWIHVQSTQLLTYISRTSWTGAKTRLAKYPWIHILHDKTGEEIWNKLRTVYGGF